MDAYIGQIIAISFNYAPTGWLMCDGSTLQVQQYQGLFALLGNAFGGDGKTTFKLPDLRGRVPLGVGNYVPINNDPPTIYQPGIAGVGGSTLAQLPAHTHQGTMIPSGTSTFAGTMIASTDPGTVSIPTPNVVPAAVVAVDNGGSGTPDVSGYGTPSNVQMAAVQLTGVTLQAGIAVVSAGTPNAPNLQPYTAINYIICTTGYYPPRP